MQNKILKKRNEFRKMAMLIIASACTFSLFAQTTKISGIVVDSKGEAIMGANVIEKKVTGNGTVTDSNGKFTLSVAKDAILQVSFIGYTTQEVEVLPDMTIILMEDTKELEEVVVVGYGSMPKSDITGSISTAKGSDIVKNQAFDALEGLRGKAAGVNIFSNTGQPGGEARVVIRGISTINASSSPLFIVDGVATANFQYFNPNDIESVEVLKDASSAAIYGARGANGVMMVTTKRGGNTGNKAQISYSGSVSASSMLRYIDMMDANEWVATFQEGLTNAEINTSLSSIFTDERLFKDGKPLYNTNWQKESTRTAISHNHQLDIQHGDANSSMGAFLNYTDQQGVLLNSYIQRVNGKLTYDDNPAKWLSTGVNLSANYTWGNRIPDGVDPYKRGALRTMIEQLPFLPVTWEDGTYTQTTDIKTTSVPDPESGKLQGFAPEGLANPVELLKRIEDLQYNTQIFGNAALTFHLTKDLDLKTQFGIDYQNTRNTSYTPATPHTIINADPFVKADNSTSFYWQEETFLTFNKLIGKHHINALAGISWQERTYTFLNVSGINYVDDSYGYYNLGHELDRPGTGSGYDRWAMNSYFVRAVHSYDSKYLTTVTGRVDGSSKFGANNKYAFFPSIGFGWMASNEQFLQEHPVISRLKPHLSYGVTGNSEIDAYSAIARVNRANVIIGDNLHTAVFFDNLPNPDLKWERTTQFDFGVDLGLFKNRLNFEVSYYHKNTTDLLLERPIPESTGRPYSISNIGEVSNRGVDVMIITYPVETPDFRWYSSFNVSYNKNRVEKLYQGTDILLDGFAGYNMLIREGEPLSTFYGSKRVGIYRGNNQIETANGEIIQADDATMIIPANVGERVVYKAAEIIGKGLPDWMGGFANAFHYKGFDLSIDLQFSLGGDVMQEFFHTTEARFLTNLLEKGMSQDVRLNNFGQGANNEADDTWVANGSYLRVNLISLGYTFSPKSLTKANLSALRLYANVNNAFLFTAADYLGYDPGASSHVDSNWGTNRQFFVYPTPRTITLGLNITF